MDPYDEDYIAEKLGYLEQSGFCAVGANTAEAQIMTRPRPKWHRRLQWWLDDQRVRLAFKIAPWLEDELEDR